MNELEQKILDLEQEILALKTATIQVSGQIKTTRQVAFWRMPMKINGEVVVPEQLLKATIVPKNGKPILASATLERFMQENFEGRHIYFYKNIQPNNSVVFTFWVIGNEDDRVKLEAGEDVSLPLVCQVDGTSAFTLQIEGIDN